MNSKFIKDISMSNNKNNTSCNNKKFTNTFTLSRPLSCKGAKDGSTTCLTLNNQCDEFVS